MRLPIRCLHQLLVFLPACLALAGAVAGVRWNHLPPKVRADIRQRVKAVRA